MRSRMSDGDSSTSPRWPKIAPMSASRSRARSSETGPVGVAGAGGGVAGASGVADAVAGVGVAAEVGGRVGDAVAATAVPASDGPSAGVVLPPLHAAASSAATTAAPQMRRSANCAPHADPSLIGPRRMWSRILTVALALGDRLTDGRERRGPDECDQSRSLVDRGRTCLHSPAGSSHPARLKRGLPTRCPGTSAGLSAGARTRGRRAGHRRSSVGFQRGRSRHRHRTPNRH